MEILKLKDKVESIIDDSGIYLIEALTDSAGFFANGGKLLYIVKDIHGYVYEGIETDYLKLQTHVWISSIKNNQTFSDDFYNIITYRGDLDDFNILSFIQLCTIYAQKFDELSFKEFFYSLITLFQLPAEQGFKNAVGLYGELKFMQYVKKRKQIDLSTFWHKNGVYSQYDFSNGNSNIEIKTTLSDNQEIIIKHQQIFGEHSCTLVAINCEQYENGETIEGVVSNMRSDLDAFNNMNFNINLAKELKRISVKDIKNTRFAIREIQFFSTVNINPFPVIPDTVSKLNYKLDISEFSPLSEFESDAILEEYLFKTKDLGD